MAGQRRPGVASWLRGLCVRWGRVVVGLFGHLCTPILEHGQGRRAEDRKDQRDDCDQQSQGLRSQGSLVAVWSRPGPSAVSRWSLRRRAPLPRPGHRATQVGSDVEARDGQDGAGEQDRDGESRDRDPVVWAEHSVGCEGIAISPASSPIRPSAWVSMFAARERPASIWLCARPISAARRRSGRGRDRVRARCWCLVVASHHLFRRDHQKGIGKRKGQARSLCFWHVPGKVRTCDLPLRRRAAMFGGCGSRRLAACLDRQFLAERDGGCNRRGDGARGERGQADPRGAGGAEQISVIVIACCFTGCARTVSRLVPRVLRRGSRSSGSGVRGWRPPSSRSPSCAGPRLARDPLVTSRAQPVAP